MHYARNVTCANCKPEKITTTKPSAPKLIAWTLTFTVAGFTLGGVQGALFAAATAIFVLMVFTEGQ